MKKRLKIILLCLLFVQISTNSYSINLVFVKGGEVQLNNKNIVVCSFRISRFEITNKQYAQFLNIVKIIGDGIFKGVQIINVTSTDLQLEYKNEHWYSKVGKEDFPMVMVNYYGALEYCNWIGGNLPSEAEWTFAAKGGNKSKSFLYSGSNSLDEVGWYHQNSDAQAHKVGVKKPNELGIYDMSGNAWEWCLNDTLKANSDFCVHKGGSWYAEAQPAQINSHYGNTPTHFSNSVGFRVIFPIK